jgi:hypothetical protein
MVQRPDSPKPNKETAMETRTDTVSVIVNGREKKVEAKPDGCGRVKRVP